MKQRPLLYSPARHCTIRIIFLAENKTKIEKIILHQIKNGRKKSRFPQLELPRALAFAVDTLIADYRSKLKGLPTHGFLFTEASDTVKLNATLSIGNEKTCIRKAENLISEGFGTLKLKTGVDFKDEFKIIKSTKAAISWNQYPHLMPTKAGQNRKRLKI
ncbi:MAG: hypothetical protein U5K69_25495 [Balneolaceae bacterium]|nr:hypothetical protein [Balneolaceae bacterium]